MVLVEICTAVGKIIRTTDSFVRCGGDEFSIIMPETDNDRAMIVAEHLRQCVEALEIRVDSEILKVKISIGLTTYSPSNTAMDKERIILMADKALLQIKKSGKNRIKSL